MSRLAEIEAELVVVRGRVGTFRMANGIVSHLGVPATGAEIAGLKADIARFEVLVRSASRFWTLQ